MKKNVVFGAKTVVITLRLYAAIMILIGLILAVGGGRLLLLGGSFYYLLTGMAIVVAGVLLWRRDRRGTRVYAVWLAATLVWALWEAGLDVWALLPRVFVPAAFGLWLFAPWTRKALGVAPIKRRWWAAGLTMVLASLGYAIHASGPETVSGASSAASSAVKPSEWLAWGGSKGGTRYSDLDQLTPQNVAGLEVAWTFETGATPRSGGAGALAFEAPPLKVGNMLYLCTPHNLIFAINAVTGKQVWRFDPHVDDRGLAFANCRGIAYHRFPDVAPDAVCAARLYMGTIDARLLAVDARNGRLCSDFGKGGQIDLRENVSPHPKAFYYVTSPPTVSGKVVITGSYGLDNQNVNQPSGVVRAYDLVTGQPVWAFDPADPERTAPLGAGEIYEPGTPNMWTVASTDEALGLVYLPFAVATPDYFGGHRSRNADRFSNTIVAVDNATGRLRWEFQTVHHDIWDYDISSQPVLTTVRSGGRDVPALISVGKTGQVFVLDRATGEPISRIEERPVPQGAVAGDYTAPTQPFSVDMPAFTGPEPSETRAWGITPLDQLWCRIAFRKMRYEGSYTPPRLDTSLEFPGNAGGVNWGSVAVDEGRRIMIVNSTIMPSHNRLITAEERVSRGMKKIPVVGGGISLEAFFLGVPMWGSPYGGIVSLPFLSPLKVPCMQPPYGTISAVDLDNRRLLWSKPFGLADRMGPMGIPARLPATIGLPTVGGSLTTKSGLTFIAATPDRRLRAYETTTGRLMWQGDLPANGNANPITYVGDDGRQYVVIAAGGSAALAFNEKNILVAFALPRKQRSLRGSP